MLDALYPLLALLELDGEIVTPEDKVRAMNQKGGAALERLAEIRNRHLPPEGLAKERAALHAAATQMQATSPYLPISPHTSPYLPISPQTSPIPPHTSPDLPRPPQTLELPKPPQTSAELSGETDVLNTWSINGNP